MVVGNDRQDEHGARIIVQPDRRTARIVLAGSVDVAALAPVEVLLQDAVHAQVETIELDLSEVSFADSSIVRLAIRAHEYVAPVGGRVTIRAPAEVRRIFDLTQTSNLFAIVPVT